MRGWELVSEEAMKGDLYGGEVCARVNMLGERLVFQEVLLFVFFLNCALRGTMVHSGTPGPKAPGTFKQTHI